MNKSFISQFTQQYSISKTLRFELKPVGETADYLSDFKSEYLKQVVEQDKKRAQQYERTKKIIDEYHRDYIEQRLKNPCDRKTGELFINSEDLENAYSEFTLWRNDKRNKEHKERYQATQGVLRNKLVKAFNDNDDLFGKDFFKKILPDWLKAKNKYDEHKEDIDCFNRFTTYFSGFNENRKNMYSGEEQSTAISYRLMNENLPRFFANCVLYRKIKENQPQLNLVVDQELLTPFENASLDDIFSPRWFINLFTQSGITAFNVLLGGVTKEAGEKVQGLNEKINLFRQANNIKSGQLDLFVPMYKQILSDIEKVSFIPESFINDEDLLITIKQFIDEFHPDSPKKLRAQIEKLNEADLLITYIKSQGLSEISIFISKEIIPNDEKAGWSIIKNAISHYAKTVRYPDDKQDGTASNKTIKNREDYLHQDVYSIDELIKAVHCYLSSFEDLELPSENTIREKIINYFSSESDRCIKKLDIKIEDIKQLLDLSEIDGDRRLPTNEFPNGGKGYQQIKQLKELLDSFLDLSHICKPLYLSKGKKIIELPEVDATFYNDFEDVYKIYENLVVGLYNKSRNFLTAKPYQQDKIKLTFSSPTLLNGWDINKEKDNKSVLLRRKGNYYLAIMHRDNSDLFTVENTTPPDSDCYEKINYKLLSGANKMLPKVFFSKKGRNTINIPDEIIEIYNKDEHKKGKKFKIESCHKLINFFKKYISTYKVEKNDKHGWAIFDFQFSPTEQYKDISVN